MTREELMKEIGELKDNRFMLQMKDSWSYNDSIAEAELTHRINELEVQLKAMED